MISVCYAKVEIKCTGKLLLPQQFRSAGRLTKSSAFTDMGLGSTSAPAQKIGMPQLEKNHHL